MIIQNALMSLCDKEKVFSEPADRNPDLHFEIGISDFTFEKSVLRVDFNLEIQIRISWISSLLFDWEIRN